MSESNNMPSPFCDESARKTLTEHNLLNVMSDIHEVLELLKRLDVKLQDCIHFGFYDKAHIDDILSGDPLRGSSFFWCDVNLRIIFVLRSAPVAIRQLTDGVLAAIGTRNDLATALSLRSLMEHASALAALSAKLEPWRTRLNEVWRCPSLMCTPEPTETDRARRADLVQFSVGGRVRIASVRLPLENSSKETWAEIYKKIAIPKGGEELATGVLNAIDIVDKSCPGWRCIYEMLCEYCHPNSASRTVEFSVELTQSGIKHYEASRQGSRLKEIPKGLELVRRVIPRVRDLVCNAIGFLSTCHIPLSPISSNSIAIGTIPGFDEWGRLIWVERRNNIDMTGLIPRELNPEQKRRIGAIIEVFSEFDDRPIETQYAAFCQDEVLPKNWARG